MADKDQSVEDLFKELLHESIWPEQWSNKQKKAEVQSFLRCLDAPDLIMFADEAWAELERRTELIKKSKDAGNN